MYDQVKSGFPKDLAEASLLTRIAPLPVLGKLLHLPMKGKMATFAFSHLGKSSYQHPLFMGRKVAELFHMPRVPVPPGLGFFSNYYNGRLNLVISYLDGLLRDDEVQMLDQQNPRRIRPGEVLMSTSCDVLVVGAGVAGAAAAVAAARGGARTMLVEKERYLGGTGFAGLFQYICGLYLNARRSPRRR